MKIMIRLMMWQRITMVLLLVWMPVSALSTVAYKRYQDYSSVMGVPPHQIPPVFADHNCTPDRKICL